MLLLLGGLALFGVEAKVGGHGALGVAGVACVVLAGLLLFDTDSSAFQVSVPAAIATGALLGGLTLFAVSKAVAARRGPPRGGAADLLGRVGTVRAPVDPLGQVFVNGALWRAQSDVPLEPGDRVRVEDVRGLTLQVTRAEEGD